MVYSAHQYHRVKPSQIYTIGYRCTWNIICTCSLMKKSPKNKDIYILFQQKDFVRKRLRLSIIPFKDAFCMAIAALYMDHYSRFIKLSLLVSIASFWFWQNADKYTIWSGSNALQWSSIIKHRIIYCPNNIFILS